MGSTLAELEAGAGALLAVLLALLLPRVAGQEAGRLQAVAQLDVVLEQGARDAVPDRPGLPGAAAALDRGDDVEFLHRLGDQERLLDDHLQHFVGKIVVQGAPVDLQGAAAGLEEDTRRGGLAPAGAIDAGLCHSFLPSVRPDDCCCVTSVVVDCCCVTSVAAGGYSATAIAVGCCAWRGGSATAATSRFPPRR